LFELWEDVCKRYERREIGEYDFEEMKESIWPNLKALASIRRAMDEMDDDLGSASKVESSDGEGGSRSEGDSGNKKSA